MNSLALTLQGVFSLSSPAFEEGEEEEEEEESET